MLLSTGSSLCAWAGEVARDYVVENNLMCWLLRTDDVMACRFALDTTREELAQLFSSAGTIKSLYMPVVLTRTPDGTKYLSKGFAFIELSDDAGFARALALDGTIHKGAPMLVKRRSHDIATPARSASAEEQADPIGQVRPPLKMCLSVCLA